MAWVKLVPSAWGWPGTPTWTEVGRGSRKGGRDLEVQSKGEREGGETMRT